MDSILNYHRSIFSQEKKEHRGHPLGSCPCNGLRFMVADTETAVRQLLQPQFEVISIGHQLNNYFGLAVSGFFFVARKRSR